MIWWAGGYRKHNQRTGQDGNFLYRKSDCSHQPEPGHRQHLPFPALDGGRLLFLIIRQVTGKKITDAMESKIHFAGLMLLFALMIISWSRM